jgi:hypothetical protein
LYACVSLLCKELALTPTDIRGVGIHLKNFEAARSVVSAVPVHSAGAGDISDFFRPQNTDGSMLDGKGASVAASSSSSSSSSSSFRSTPDVSGFIASKTKTVGAGIGAYFKQVSQRTSVPDRVVDAASGGGARDKAALVETTPSTVVRATCPSPTPTPTGTPTASILVRGGHTYHTNPDTHAVAFAEGSEMSGSVAKVSESITSGFMNGEAGCGPVAGHPGENEDGQERVDDGIEVDVEEEGKAVAAEKCHQESSSSSSTDVEEEGKAVAAEKCHQESSSSSSTSWHQYQHQHQYQYQQHQHLHQETHHHKDYSLQGVTMDDIDCDVFLALPPDIQGELQAALTGKSSIGASDTISGPGGGVKAAGTFSSFSSSATSSLGKRDISSIKKNAVIITKKPGGARGPSGKNKNKFSGPSVSNPSAVSSDIGKTNPMQQWMSHRGVGGGIGGGGDIDNLGHNTSRRSNSSAGAHEVIELD